MFDIKVEKRLNLTDEELIDLELCINSCIEGQKDTAKLLERCPSNNVSRYYANIQRFEDLLEKVRRV